MSSMRFNPINHNLESDTELTDGKIVPVPLWGTIIAGYFIYFLFFLVGYLSDASYLNVVGVACFLAILLIGNYRNMLFILKVNTVYTALFILIVPIASSLVHYNNIEVGYLIKHSVIYALYILIYSYNINSRDFGEMKKYFYFIYIIIVLFSILTGKTFEHGEERRFSGIFVNPNTFALIGLSLLFLIDETKDSSLRKFIIYLIVLSITIVTSTAGAMLAFFTGIVFKYRKHLFNLRILSTLLVLTLIGAFFVDVLKLQIINKFYTQAVVLIENIDRIDFILDMDYGSITTEGTSSSLSGIWRLAHWTKGLMIFAQGSIYEVLFGYGVGSSIGLLGKLPHNDYLRVLLEQGIVGMLLFIYFFRSIYSKLDSQYRYILVILAIFSISENVIDNMLFMILFILFIVVTQQERRTSQQYAPMVTA